MSGFKGRRGGRLGLLCRQNGDTNSGDASSIPQTEQTQHTNSPQPLQLQLEEQPINSPPTQHSSAGSSHVIKKGRGVYKSNKVMLRTKFSKIKVQLSDNMTRAVGSEARNLVNYCGLIVRKTVSLRNCITCKAVLEKYGTEMKMQVKDKFTLDGVGDEEKFDQVLTLAFQNALRNWKTNLHRHYQKYDNDEERLADPPSNVSSEDWEWLLTYFKSENFKKKSTRNKQNRKKQVTKHTCGPVSFAEMDHSAKDPTTGQPAPPDLVWQITHTRKRNTDGQSVWADAHSQQIYVRLKELREQQELESDARMTSDEILTTVLGERSGYVRGKGYGAQPPRKRANTQSSQSSLDHVRTELQQEFDRRIQEEREKMEVNLALERAKMEEERVQFEQRMQDKLNAFMQMFQSNAPISTSTPTFGVPPTGPSM